MRQLLIVGDSHVYSFTTATRVTENPYFHDYSPFHTHWLGPYTAYNLRDKAKVGRTIIDHWREGMSLAFSAGEIDCRRHVVWQAEKQNRSIEDVANEVGEVYVDLMQRLSVLDPIAITCVYTSGSKNPTKGIEPEAFAYYGSKEERDLATDTFNSVLRNSGFPYLELDKLSLRYGRKDGCHCMGQEVRDALVAQWEEICRKRTLPLPSV